MDAINAKCAMSASSGIDTFRFSTQQLAPSLGSSLRTLRIRSVALTFPAMQSAGVATPSGSPKVQFFWADPVSGTPTALTPQRSLSLVSPTRMTVRIPNYYSQFYGSNSTALLFAIVFTFTNTETGVYDVTINTRFDLGFEPPPLVTPAFQPQQQQQHQGFEMINSPVRR